MFNPRIYPNDQHAKAAIACTVHITPRHSDRHYLSLLNRHLTESLDAFQPDFLLYNAGTDCLQGDALGRLNITPEGIIKRDEMVFRACFERERRIPILMVLSGGYQMSNATVIADSIVNLHEKFDLFNAQQLRNQ